MNVEQAIIVCGGLGSRLGKITKKTPKPLLKVENTTVLEHIIKNLSRFGIKEILLLCGYKQELFKKKFNNKIIFGIKIKCVIEKKLLGTSGALYNAKKFLKKTFLFCNADTFFDININDLVNNFFVKKKFIAFIALKQVLHKNKRYDYFKFTKKNFLVFAKKKKFNLVNSGFCIFSNKIIKYLVKEGSLEKDVFPKLTNKKLISGKKYNNEFIDMGTIKDLKRLPKFLKRKNFKPALFLDRDGVINKDIGYLYKKNDFVWRKNIINFIKKINNKNYYVFVITNQSGVGRGYYKKEDVINLHSWINQNLQANGANIDEFFFSPFYKDSKIKKYRKDKIMRKPNIGMIKAAQKKWSIDLKKSLLIGDNLSDKQTAINAGIRYKILKFQSYLK